MMDDPEGLPSHTAKRTLEMILETEDFYFPPLLRERYEAVANRFESKDQDYWLQQIGTKRQDISEAFSKLGEWVDFSDSSLLMQSWSDEVLFFNVLRTQFVFSQIAVAPDSWLPGELDSFWAWVMTPKDDEPWMIYPFFTQQNFEVSDVKPPMWRIPYPIDYMKNP